MFSLRSLPGLLLLVVYSTLSLVAPVVVVCHGHAEHGLTATEVAVCGAHSHASDAHAGCHEHDARGHHVQGNDDGCDDEPTGCDHSVDQGVHERVGTELVRDAEPEAPHLAAPERVGVLSTSVIPSGDAATARPHARSRAPPPRVPLAERPATLLL